MRCCQIDCADDAEFRIEWNVGPDNYTESCEAHVGALLGHRPEEPEPDCYRVYPIGRAQKSTEPQVSQHATADLVTGSTEQPAPSTNIQELLAAAKAALAEMCRTNSPRNSFTDAVDRLDAAISTAERTGAQPK
jgi:hypothetical protein